MQIVCFSDSLLLKMTLYLDEDDLVELSLISSQFFDKVRGNIKIQNRMLAYQLRYTQSHLSVSLQGNSKGPEVAKLGEPVRVATA